MFLDNFINLSAKDSSSRTYFFSTIEFSNDGKGLCISWIEESKLFYYFRFYLNSGKSSFLNY